MQNISAIRDKTFYILGLARTGLATADFLINHQAEVYVWDDCANKRQEAQDKGYPMSAPDRIDWSKIYGVCVSPGVPIDYPQVHPVIAMARRHKLPILNDIMLMGLCYPQNMMIGITGTNGKSTTTALIGHLLQELGFSVAVGGNIGIACLGLPDLGDEGIYILEVSSFQLDLLSRSPFSIAVLLNFSADHLDRHGNMENYIHAKMKIFERDSQVRIIGVDDQYCQNIARTFVLHSSSASSLLRVSGKRTLDNGVFVNEDVLMTKTANDDREIGSTAALRELKGDHNHQNIAAAVAACLSVCQLKHKEPPTNAAIMKALSSFHALPHRQQLVVDWRNITFINDSKATNWDAAQNSLSAFEHILWIAGGRPKDKEFRFEKKQLKNVCKAFLIGEAKDLLAQGLQGLKEFTSSGTLDTALEDAVQYAQAFPDKHFHILLAPACTSFDQFQDYEDRGRAFESLVRKTIA